MSSSLNEQHDEKGNHIILINSTGNFGNVFQDTKSFDDEEFFSDSLFNFKISRVKIFHGKIDRNEIVTGIQIFYRDRIKGNTTTTGEFKSEKGSDLYEELNLEANENLVNFQIRTGEKGVDYLEFGTNKGKNIKCGGNTGEEKITDFNNNQDKIILGFFGGYSNCLNSLWVYYISKKDFVSVLYAGLFNLRYVLKKNLEFKKKILENKDKLNNDDYAILKVCLLPDAPFCSVMRYVLC